VFSRHFRERRTPAGKNVNSYEDLLDYLCAKHPSVRRQQLPFDGSNTVIYSLGTAAREVNGSELNSGYTLSELTCEEVERHGTEVLGAHIAGLYNTAILRTEGHFLVRALKTNADCAALCANPDGCFVLASAEGPEDAEGSESFVDSIVGLCRYTKAKDGGDAHVSMVCVRKNDCRKGIAGRLIEHVCAKGRQDCAQRIGLHIPSPRQDMEQYYGNRGFHFDHEEPMPEQYLPMIRPECLPMTLRWMYRRIASANDSNAVDAYKK
jgi:hypothetical protein